MPTEYRQSIANCCSWTPHCHGLYHHYHGLLVTAYRQLPLLAQWLTSNTCIVISYHFLLRLTKNYVHRLYTIPTLPRTASLLINATACNVPKADTPPGARTPAWIFLYMSVILNVENCKNSSASASPPTPPPVQGKALDPLGASRQPSYPCLQ
jgi:hypothetical protein